MTLGEEPRGLQRDFGRPCSAITVHHSQFDAIEKKALFYPPPLLPPALHHRQDAASSVLFSVFAVLRPHAVSGFGRTVPPTPSRNIRPSPCVPPYPRRREFRGRVFFFVWFNFLRLRRLHCCAKQGPRPSVLLGRSFLIRAA